MIEIIYPKDKNKQAEVEMFKLFFAVDDSILQGVSANGNSRCNVNRVEREKVRSGTQDTDSHLQKRRRQTKTIYLMGEAEIIRPCSGFVTRSIAFIMEINVY